MFDPTKRVAVELKAIRRARFWADVRLYALVLAILAIPAALALWLIIEAFGL